MVIYHEMNILKFTKVQGATGWFKNCPCQCSMQAGKPIPILSHWCISFHELEDLHFQFVVFPHHGQEWVLLLRGIWSQFCFCTCQCNVI